MTVNEEEFWGHFRDLQLEGREPWADTAGLFIVNQVFVEGTWVE